MASTIETKPVSDLPDETKVGPISRAPRRRAVATWVLAFGAVAGVGALAIAVASDDSSTSDPVPPVAQSDEVPVDQDPLVTRFGVQAGEVPVDQDPLVTRFGVQAGEVPVDQDPLVTRFGVQAEARPQAIEDEAVTTAISFIEARDHWDGEAVRSLVAADAVIDEFAVTTVEDYLANAEFERIIEWRFLQPACAATDVSPPVEVTCTYLMKDALSEALDVGPYTGSSIELVIEDGQIRHVNHHFDYSQYSGQAFEVFTGWLVDAHPGDIDIMLDITDGSAMRSTTPESLALWAQRIPEFVASSSHS